MKNLQYPIFALFALLIKLQSVEAQTISNRDSLENVKYQEVIKDNLHWKYQVFLDSFPKSAYAKDIKIKMSKFETYTVAGDKQITLTNEVLREKYNWVGTAMDIGLVLSTGKIKCAVGSYSGGAGGYIGDFTIGNLEFYGEVVLYSNSLLLFPGTKMIYPLKMKNITNAESEKKVMSMSNAQKTLLRLGYDPGPIDGKSGRKTEEALKSFQKDNNLIVTGKLDAKTIEMLFKK